MDDRVREGLQRWRDATEHAQPPPGLTDSVVRLIEAPGFAEAIGSVARPVIFAGAIAAAVLIGVAVGSVHTLAVEAADYAMSRAP